MEADIQHVHQQIEDIFRQDAGRVRAALISSFKDFELAEDVLQEAFMLALEHWQHDGTPTNPAAWLLTTARHKAIDRLRRSALLTSKQEQLQVLATIEQQSFAVPFHEPFPDDRLKLIFTCCHPALNMEARVALTLHSLGGMTTLEIAHAFLVSETTMAQRLVRAKRKIRDAGIPYSIPALDHLSERLDGVLAVLYLIFNAGYSASFGEKLIRQDLCAEAIRLTRALVTLLAKEQTRIKEPEVSGLLALMLLHDSRRDARVSSTGAMIILEEQDRTLWNKTQIEEGIALLDTALACHSPGSYQIQAAIAALHAEALCAEKTDWLQISLLYAELVKRNPSSLVIKLNWVVAIAMASTPQQGLDALAELHAEKDLQAYYLFHATRADLLRRVGAWQAASHAYQQALTLTHNTVVQAFLQRRITEMHALHIF